MVLLCFALGVLIEGPFLAKDRPAKGIANGALEGYSPGILDPYFSPHLFLQAGSL